MEIVIFGLSMTSSWGNGHATNFRALVRALTARGHRVLFLERDVPWYAANRDLPRPPWGRLQLYDSIDEVRDRYSDRIRRADAVIVGSFVPEGVPLGHWVNDTARGTTVFYDLDTPVTLAKIEEGDREYLEPALVARYDLYLSFTGGPVLRALEDDLGSPTARAFHCLVDPDVYRPRNGNGSERWDLGYLGTYSDDRQPGLERLLLEPARRNPERRFCVAGPRYPEDVSWPRNVEREEHLPPPRHRDFYTGQRFTLNVTRARMVRAGWSPSVRLFEAAACGTPVISDPWEGLDRFFRPGDEILVAEDSDDVLRILHDVETRKARALGRRARDRVLREHTARHRTDELLSHLLVARERRDPRDRPRYAQTSGQAWEETSGTTSEKASGKDEDPGGDRPSIREAGEDAPAAGSAPHALKEEIRRLGPWFHNLHLPGGVQTAPHHDLGDFPRFKWEALSPHLPADLSGWTALDVGCNAGFYSFELARRGARVLGIDHDDHYLDQARWAADRFGLSDRVTFRWQEVYDVGRSDERYDLVLFMGVFYHLRYPLLGLDAVARATDRILVFQSLSMPGDEVREDTGGLGLENRDAFLSPGWPRMAFIEHELAGDPTNWWAPDRACVEAMLRSTGMDVTARPEAETYLCSPRAGGVDSPWWRNQMRAALGSDPRPRSPAEGAGEDATETPAGDTVGDTAGDAPEDTGGGATEDRARDTGVQRNPSPPRARAPRGVG